MNLSIVAAALTVGLLDSAHPPGVVTVTRGSTALLVANTLENNSYRVGAESTTDD
jgi:hypothetical protein